MTAAQVAAQMAVEAANSQKSRCELLVDSVGLCEQFMLAFSLLSLTVEYYSKTYFLRSSTGILNNRIS